MPSPVSFKLKTTAEIQHAFHSSNKSDVAAAGDDPFLGMITSSLSQSLPKPRAGDWLKEHEERGQTLQQFEKCNFKICLHGTFDTLLLQQIGNFSAPDDGSSASLLMLLKNYIEVFFPKLIVHVLPVVELPNIPYLVTRINDGVLQLRIPEIKKHLLSSMSSDRILSRRALAIVGVTMEDIYPGDDWNFVYGQASPMEGVGIFSFARYKIESQQNSSTTAAGNKNIFLERCCKVVTHEIGHLCGLRHCIYQRCLMNGVNHEGELDRQLLHLCPLCLKKLCHSFKWDMKSRFSLLANFYATHAFEEELAYSNRVLEYFEAMAVNDCRKVSLPQISSSLDADFGSSEKKRKEKYVKKSQHTLSLVSVK